jgi:hypothetical protein
MATLEFKIEADVSGIMTLTVKRGTITRTATMSTPPSTSSVLHLSTGSYMYPRFEFIGVISNTTPTVCASISYADLLDTRGSPNINATLTIKNNATGLFGSVPFHYSYSNNHLNSLNHIGSGFTASHNFTYYVPSPNVTIFGVHVVIGYAAIGFRNIVLHMLSILQTNNPADLIIMPYTTMDSDVQSGVPTSLDMTSEPFSMTALGTTTFENSIKDIPTGLNISSTLNFLGLPVEPSALIVSNISINGPTQLNTVIQAISSQLYATVSANTIGGYTIQSVIPTPITPTPASSWS